MTRRVGNAAAADVERAVAIALVDERRSAMAEEVRDGLGRRQKELPPKYFYDERGSELFERITRLPEYYLTRAERGLLEEHSRMLIETLRPRTLVELGAGSAAKTRILLDAMRDAGCAEQYVPVDVSEDFLADTATRLREEYPALRVTPAIADISMSLGIPERLPRPALFAFLGSTIGNFDAPSARALLARVRVGMRPFDRLLLGTDLRKQKRVVEAAYNDARGVTAAFNRNMLRVLNRELGADFDVASFAHRAFYSTDRHRIEMHLVSAREQVVHIPRVGDVHLTSGETIRTEISCKYDRPSVRRLLRAASLKLERWITDGERFALAVALPRL
ncbi:MAG TPA: L-histidine N(alpha)-methyltransferase [Gemmatimonadaceae bacterium]|nr:L-histidine N(alpha)-methyltransferase [Gemmatimonadaceae bacterium]